jgi:hypothetical protein
MLRMKTLCVALLLIALPAAGVVRLNGNRIEVDLSQQ